MAYKFTTPNTQETPYTGVRLFDFLKVNRGVTVYRSGASYGEIMFPAQEFLESVDEYWLGGHIYEVDDSTAAGLSAAGYSDNLEEI